MQPLKGKIAVVTGATRGAGRGIACMLGEAGATVYCTGRSVRGKPATGNRPETIEETAEMVNAWGGVGIPVQVDHTVEEQVKSLFEQIKSEQGQLDILVNDIWGGDTLMEWGKPFWEQSLSNGLLMQQRGIHTHIITSHYAIPLMVERKQGLIVEVTDGDSLGYRGNFFYDLAKVSIIRLAYAMSKELLPYNITSVAVTPGFLRSEAMLEHFGVTEANWQEGAKKDPHFIASETPFFIGRAIAALAADPEVKQYSGKVLSSWNLSTKYGFTDIDGRKPHWGNYFDRNVENSASYLDSFPFGVNF
ncbi:MULTISPECIES: SDR family oxidoreductase [Nostocales]|uniref:SDR family oxidoreductase n=3 Tax=Nostocales TaxID=1161 RepID=A0A0C1N6C3_9CYAN|nr:SDR family oxidoreductase [Tolypothrix bouteillei]KAF3888473.1 SDR family oxidoreductase [Tolypothrix bouteillei VB521301]